MEVQDQFQSKDGGISSDYGFNLSFCLVALHFASSDRFCPYSPSVSALLSFCFIPHSSACRRLGCREDAASHFIQLRVEIWFTEQFPSKAPSRSIQQLSPVFYFLLQTDGLCGSSRTTRAKHGRPTCASSPSLTRWKIFGRKQQLMSTSPPVMEGLLTAALCFSLYNHIQLSSNLMSGCDYSLFKVCGFTASCAEPAGQWCKVTKDRESNYEAFSLTASVFLWILLRMLFRS